MRRPRGRRRAGARRLAVVAALVTCVLLCAALAAVARLARLARRAEREAVAAGGGTAAATGVPGAPRPEAVVVLGAAASREGPSGELRARLDHAVRLWRQGVAPLILVSGGTSGDVDEALVMRTYLVTTGIPPAAVAAALPGDTTRATLRTLARRGPGPYVLVSSPYHALRLRVEARRQGVDATVSAPASTPETRRPATHRVRFGSELFAVVWYALPSSWTARTSTRPGTARHVVPHVLIGRRPPRDLLTILRGRDR